MNSSRFSATMPLFRPLYIDYMTGEQAALDVVQLDHHPRHAEDVEPVGWVGID